MRLIATMPVRSEDWVIGLTLRAALLWNDAVVALNHASTDRTATILAEIKSEVGDRLKVIEESDPGWPEMAHRQRCLDEARRMKATHVSIVDADEILTGNLLETIRAQVDQMPPGACLQIPMRNMHNGGETYRDDATCWGRAITTLAFCDAPALSWQAKNGYQHHAREPRNSRVACRVYPQQMDGGVMHLQFASRRRLLAKHAWYKLHERVTYPSKPVYEIDHLYSMAPDLSAAAFSQAPDHWWMPYHDLLPGFVVDSEPWHEQACREIIAQHGRAHFKGLDLFGVV